MKLGVVFDSWLAKGVTALVAGYLLFGCRSLGGAAPKGTPEAHRECAGLDSQHRAWGAIAAGSGVLAGSGGLSAAAVGGDDKALKLSLAISSAVFGAVGAGAAFMSNRAAASHSERCK